MRCGLAIHRLQPRRAPRPGRGLLRRLGAVVALIVVTAATLAATTPTLGAACAGPNIVTTTGAFDRGATITVIGSAFGDGCYDIETPPTGQGGLGRPVQDIEVALVQGDQSVPLARGDADEEYRFHVDAVIPPTARPGHARVHVRWVDEHGANDLSHRPIVITGARPTSDATVVRFGPTTTMGADDQPEPTVSSGDEAAERAGAGPAAAPAGGGDRIWPWGPTLGGLLAVVAVGVLALRTRRTWRRSRT